MSGWHSTFEKDVRDFQPLAPEPDAAPCGDCAAPEFYREIVDALKAEPNAEFREQVASRWFCHAQPNRRCRGVRDALDGR